MPLSPTLTPFENALLIITQLFIPVSEGNTFNWIVELLEREG